MSLDGVRVLELGGGVSAAYATKLLADWGAEVVKVEDPAGDRARRMGPFPAGTPHPETSGLFLYLNTNKRGVSIDPVHDRPRLERLISWAEILIHNHSPREAIALGLVGEQLRVINPRLVSCSITPFGLTGRHRDYEACELTLAHAGGWATLSPGASKRPELPPLKAAGPQAELQGGLAAATASLAAYFRAQADGVGEQIDLSIQEFVASFLEQSFVHFTYAGRVASRLGKRILYPWGLYPCRDGLIFLVVVEQDQWLRLVELMGNPEWASWEVFDNPFARGENSDVLETYLKEWFTQQNVMDLFHKGQERRICFAPVFTLADLEKQEHLESRKFFVPVSHPVAGTISHPGAPYRLSEPWWSIRRPAPKLGEHDSEVLDQQGSDRAAPKALATAGDAVKRGRPLEGVRVADFSWAWAGPFCGMHLAHLGAEVIKIESTARPDLGRRVPIYPKGVEPGLNRSGYFNQWNQGKKSIFLNLAVGGATDLAKQLIGKCDVVLENYATGVMERLGLGYEELRKVKPDVIMASISGYGHTGPYRHYMGYGPAIVPLSGLTSVNGYPGGEPEEVGISYGDPNGGINAAVAVCAALVAKRRTGKGVHIDLSLWESMTVLNAEAWMGYAMNGIAPAPIGNRDPWMAPHGCFRCLGEDDWVSIACRSDEEWKELCLSIDRADWIADPRFRTASDRKANEDALDEMIGNWTRGRDKWEVTRLLQARCVPAFPSMTTKDLALDPHLEERGFFARLEHPEVGVQTHAGIPWRLGNSPNGVASPAPCMGQHTDEILRDIVGLSDDEVQSLKARGILS